VTLAVTTLKLGTLSVIAARGDKDANLATIELLVSRCAEQGAELVVTPEGFLEGYVVKEPGMHRERFMELAEPLDGPYVERLRALAWKRRVWLLVCLAERERERAYNTARGRRHPAAPEARPDGGGGDLVVQLEQPPREPLVAPSGVLPGQPHHQLHDARRERWPARAAPSPKAAHRRRTSARCQRSSVSGRTGKPCHSGRGRQRLRAATIRR
jgi:Carbon-nitrogen hydrolase